MVRAVSSTVPAAPTHNPVRRIAQDVRHEFAERGNYPPGEHGFSARRTHLLATDPLPVLLSMYERYGPVFTVRTLHVPQVFALGPEANHYITVSHAANFRWRDGGFAELEPLLGDGLLTIDGAYHRRARKVMLPGFHRTQIAEAAEVMVEEITGALDHWRPGMTFDLYTWARTLAMRIAMKALMGLDPDGDGVGARAAEEFEKALPSTAPTTTCAWCAGPARRGRRCCARGPSSTGSSTARSSAAARAGVGQDDILDMLLAATDDEGTPADRPRGARPGHHPAVRGPRHDHVHDQLPVLRAGAPPARGQLLLRGAGAVLDGGRAPTAARPGRRHAAAGDGARRGAAPYPPAWIGPRRAVEAFELAGVHVPRARP